MDKGRPTLDEPIKLRDWGLTPEEDGPYSDELLGLLPLGGTFSNRVDEPFNADALIACLERQSIYSDVSAERERQNEKHGAQVDVPVVREDVGYGLSERAAKAMCDRTFAEGRGSHAAIILEELAEVIHAATPEEMDKELVQLTASCVKALEAHRSQMRKSK